jgi:hypothetical protein
MVFQKMAEVQAGGFIRSSGPNQVNASKAAQRRLLI